MEYYKNSKIPVENFYGYISEKKYSYLLIKKKKLSKKNKKTLDLAFRNIFYEHCYLTGDSTLFDEFKKEIYLEYIQGKINSITKILDLYEQTEDSSVLELLTSLEIPFTLDKPIEPQVKRAIRKVKGLRNRYNIFIAKMKIKNKNKSNQKYNVEEQALSIELSLKLKYPIDISTCRLSKWDSMLKLIKNQKNG
jgi:hypothetical protein